MKKAALATVLAATVVLAPWYSAQSGEAGDFLHGQRLYSLGDYAGALNIWQGLAQQGDARSQYSMAVLYLKGRGVAKDRAKAKEWATLAAKQGYKPGQSLLQKLQKRKPRQKVSAKPKQRKAKSEVTELERIKASVEELLLHIGGKIAKDGRLQYGDLRAVQLADAIEITIPEVKVHGADGSLFDIGTVVTHVRHLDSRFDDITIALPEKMRFRQPGVRSGYLTIAERLAQVRWDRQLEISIEFEFSLGDLRFLLDGSGELGRIGEILVHSDVLEKDGLWSGPIRIALSQVQMTDGAPSALHLDNATIVLDLRGLDIPAYNQSQNQTAQEKNGGLPLKQILTLASGVGLHTSIKNLVVRHPRQGDFRLEAAEYGLGLSSTDGKLLKLTLTAGHSGLSSTGGGAPKGMVPREIDIDLAMENIPSETIISVGIAAAIEMTLLGQISSSRQVFERLRQELSAAATVMRLKRAKILAKDYEIFLDLNLLADGDAKAGMVGSGELRIKGLDKLLTTSSSGEIPLISALVKKGKKVQDRRGHLFILAVQPNGMLTVNEDPVVSLAPVFDNSAKK